MYFTCNCIHLPANKHQTQKHAMDAPADAKRTQDRRREDASRAPAKRTQITCGFLTSYFLAVLYAL